MKDLELVFIGLGITAFIFVFTSLLFLVLFLLQQRQIKLLDQKKGQRGRRRRARRKRQLRHKQRQSLRWLLLFVLLVGLTGGSAVVTKKFMSTALTQADLEAVERSYYLVADFEAELNKVAEQSEAEATLVGNLTYLTNSLASYGLKKASLINAPEGQRLLNRYYNSLKEFALNTATANELFYGNQGLIDEYQADLARIKENQQTVLTYFDVDEAVLKGK